MDHKAVGQAGITTIHNQVEEQLLKARWSFGCNQREISTVWGLWVQCGRSPSAILVASHLGLGLGLFFLFLSIRSLESRVSILWSTCVVNVCLQCLLGSNPIVQLVKNLHDLPLNACDLFHQSSWAPPKIVYSSVLYFRCYYALLTSFSESEALNVPRKLFKGNFEVETVWWTSKSVHNRSKLKNIIKHVEYKIEITLQSRPKPCSRTRRPTPANLYLYILPFGVQVKLCCISHLPS